MTQPLSRLVHDRTGTGEPVVLIHGIGYDVVRLDLAGFGESPAYPVGVPYTMDNACADLAANFAEWGLERPHVVGNSLGGAISLELAARGLVSSATVLSPAGFFGRVERLWPLTALSLMRLASRLPDGVLWAVARSRVGRRMVGHLLYTHPERATAESTYADSLALKRTTAFFPAILAGLHCELEASGIDVPVTVAWGTRDRLLRYRQSREAQRRLPTARHLPLPECGHVPMIDDPELVVAVIEETIDRAEASAAA